MTNYAIPDSPSHGSNFRSRQQLSISGYIKKIGTVFASRVRLYEKITGRLVADIQADEHGYYEFNGIFPAEYYIVAHDPSRQFNAVIQDNVVPK